MLIDCDIGFLTIFANAIKQSKKYRMTKADIVQSIIASTGIEKPAATIIVEAIMETIKQSLVKGENVYLRGFGTFLLIKRKEKTGRNITKNTTVKIPAHMIPKFKPAKEFTEDLKAKVKVR